MNAGARLRKKQHLFSPAKIYTVRFHHRQRLPGALRTPTKKTAAHTGVGAVEVK